MTYAVVLHQNLTNLVVAWACGNALNVYIPASFGTNVATMAKHRCMVMARTGGWMVILVVHC